MKHLIRGIALLLTLTLTLCPLFALAETTATVTGGWLRLRAEPSTKSLHITSYDTGAVMTILSTTGDWSYVRTPDGLTGYMMSKYLVTATSGNNKTNNNTTPTGGKTMYVTTSNGRSVNLRSGAGTNYTVLAQYPVGTAVQVHSTNGGWSYVTVGTATGYIMSSCLSSVKINNPTGVALTNITMYITSKNGRSVNLRISPSTTAAVISSYKVDTQVQVLNKGNDWSYVSVNNQLGYMMTQFLTTTKPKTVTNNTNTTTTNTTGTVAYVKSGNGQPINFRSGPGTNYKILGKAPSGTQITVVKHGNIWSFVRIGTVYGYMMTQFITTKK